MPRTEEYRTLDELLREEFREKFLQWKAILLQEGAQYRRELRRFRSRGIDDDDIRRPRGIRVMEVGQHLLDEIADWRPLGMTPEQLDLIPPGRFEDLMAALRAWDQVTLDDEFDGAREAVLAIVAQMRGDE